MNENIIRMAQEAGIGVKKDLEDWHVPVWHLGIDYLVRFAALVAAAEREECAKVCEQMPDLEHGWRANLPSDCADAIRVRGEKE